MKSHIAQFVKDNRKSLKLSQVVLAVKSGIGFRFIRELKQSKETLEMPYCPLTICFLPNWLCQKMEELALPLNGKIDSRESI